MAIGAYHHEELASCKAMRQAHANVTKKDFSDATPRRVTKILLHQLEMLDEIMNLIIIGTM